MLNRSLVIVKVKEPFQKWLQALPEPFDATLEVLNQDPSCYLLPQYEDDSEREHLMGQIFDYIFEEQLYSYWTQESDWPSIRDLETFKQWFSLEFSSLVEDLVDLPLEDDDA